MICYKDKTFCGVPLSQCTCPEDRRITLKVIQEARKWWGSDDPPFCIGTMCSGNKVSFIDTTMQSPAIKAALERARSRSW